MPAGIFHPSFSVVKEKFIVSTASIPYESPSSDDLYDGMKVLIRYILSRKQRKFEVKCGCMQPVNWGKLIQSLIKAFSVLFSKSSISPPLPQPIPPAPVVTSPVSPVSSPPSRLQSTGFLGCPIQANDVAGKPVTPFSVKVSAVVDHSDTAIDPTSSKNWGLRAKDKTVKAFNGEVGDGEASAGPPIGYAKKTPGPFFASGELNYIGAGGNGQTHPNTWYLQYDGHAGYDFPYPRMTPILVTADGELHKATDAEDKAYGQGWGAHHTFYVRHDNGYASWYRHCTKLVDEIEERIGSDHAKSCPVKQGDVVAYIGDFGFPGSIHLHFEIHDVQGKIVDPYGDKLWV